MYRPITPGLFLLLAACGAQINGNPAQGGPDAAVAGDAGADAVPDAPPLGPWLAPTAVMVAATSASEDDVTLSSNALEMIFAVQATGGKDLYYASRATAGDTWISAVPLPFDSAGSDETPRFSGDDRTLYFASDRDTGNLDIYAVTRPAAGSTMWDAPVAMAAVNTGATEKWFAPCGAGRYVVVRSVSGGGTHLFEGTPGSAPSPIDSLNSPTASDTGAFLTQDCLTIYFASFRVSPEKIFVSHRATASSAWPAPSPVDDFRSTGGDQEDPWLSPDGRTFVFASDAGGNKDVYVSTR